LADTQKLQHNGGNDYAGIRMGARPLSQLGNGSWQKYLAHAAGIGQSGPRQPFFTSDCATGGEGQAVDAVAGGIGDIWRLEPDVGRVAHGVPDRTHRLAALGNAVVPQIPELIGRAILASLKERQIDEVNT
jgi:DNA (cytosine-5)-methyltransferase 1